MVLRVYFRCDLLCSLANTPMISMDMMNHILFAHTRLVSVIAIVIKHTYLLQGAQ